MFWSYNKEFLGHDQTFFVSQIYSANYCTTISFLSPFPWKTCLFKYLELHNNIIKMLLNWLILSTCIHWHCLLLLDQQMQIALFWRILLQSQVKGNLNRIWYCSVLFHLYWTFFLYIKSTQESAIIFILSREVNAL